MVTNKKNPQNDCQELDLVRTIVHLKICCTQGIFRSVYTNEMPRWNFNKPESELYAVKRVSVKLTHTYGFADRWFET